jgi:hypothetical protein
MQKKENCADIHGNGAEVHGGEDEEAEIDVDAKPEYDNEDTKIFIIVEPEKDTSDPFISKEGTTADFYTNY